MPRWSSPLTAAAVALTCFLLVYAAIALSGSAPTRWHALGVAACGAVGGLIGWWWVIFKSGRDRPRGG